jgi:hypothetical protein
VPIAFFELKKKKKDSYTFEQTDTHVQVLSLALAFLIHNKQQLMINNEQANRLSPPRTLILDFTMTHTCFGWSTLHTIGQLTHTRRSMVFLNLMVLSRQWSGIKYVILGKITIINQTQCPVSL